MHSRKIKDHLVALTAMTSSLVSAQSCVSLQGSKLCSGFNASSISTTNPTILGYFPFLSTVNSSATFDSALQEYLNTTYIQQQFIGRLGCKNASINNITDLYSQYTTSFVCNEIVQNSITPCGLTGSATRALCGYSCGQFANSEATIVSNSAVCGTSENNYASIIRADYTNCGLPTGALSPDCITGAENEPENCGFSTNLQGLCGYCAESSVNATDSCCSQSNVAVRCKGVVLPPSVTGVPMFPASPSTTSVSSSSSSSSSTSSASGSATSTSASSPAASPGSSNNGLSGGAIAGIVIGSVVAALLLLVLIVLILICVRRRRRIASAASSLNQPSPAYRPGVGGGSAAPSMTQIERANPAPAFGGRVTRLDALEDTTDGARDAELAAAGLAGLGAAKFASDSEKDYETPRGGTFSSRTRGTRDGPVSSAGRPSTENINALVSSPEGNSSSQSEQLPFFKDYYSEDNIHPGDKVAVLWGYQPRANDEFELVRGELLKVVGIWDDGWATGIKIRGETADDYSNRASRISVDDVLRRRNRDSGVSSGPAGAVGEEDEDGQVKAFPLVCVCLPEHWRRTIDGGEAMTSTETRRHTRRSSVAEQPRISESRPTDDDDSEAFFA